MGGTIVRLQQQGWKLGILDLTNGEPTPLGSPERRAAETAAANAALGSPWRQNLDLPNRSLEPSLAHRRALAAVFRQVQPRLLFAPYWEDAHPDHIAATKLVEEARFWSKLTKSDIPGQPFHPSRILYYFSVHLRIIERPSLLLDVSDQVERQGRRPQLLPVAARRQPARGSAGRDRIGLRSHSILGSPGRSPPCGALRQPRADRVFGVGSVFTLVRRSEPDGPLAGAGPLRRAKSLQEAPRILP